MAKAETRNVPRRKVQAESLPFTQRNYQILGAGLLLIVMGYVALGQEPWDGTVPLVVAPILLVLGYCVVIPLGILYRAKAEAVETTSNPAEKPAQ
ncbi:MAG: hypothetical protein A3H45_04795 [Ignavibacteria bacterium RIFCSPLOWO2_02_FULL_55_14]|nr:MAG: hypothetical protein A3H45_04795 [Ignavibacteria bacterium RIFCSPLOWO2_02_FULL_55_14]OGU76685.1 MAG: hypothetical protein A3G43_03690 [Ignavibacteria bacterium RIFCSPLOWO2_12_FULL_56_21]